MSALDDIASDFSRFHGIRDAGSLRSRVFLRLAARLEAYGGVMTARRLGTLTTPGRAPAPAEQRSALPRYITAPSRAGHERTAAAAPPATETFLNGLNAQIGSRWFSYRTVPADGGEHG